MSGAPRPDDLLRRVERLRASWGLVDVGDPFRRTESMFVAPVRDATGAERVLKVVRHLPSAASEVAALAHWGGHGAVSLVKTDPTLGALLLERAVPGQDLLSRCMADDRAATAEAASVMAKLRGAQGPAAADLPDLSAWFRGVEPSIVTGGASRELRDGWSRAIPLATELLEGAGRHVLHGDLHHLNILSASREPWLAVDPKGAIGPVEAEAAALLRNPRDLVLSDGSPLRLLADRVDVIAERLGDDPGRLALWGYVLAVVAAAWAHEDQEGEAEVRAWLACARLLWRVAHARSDA